MSEFYAAATAVVENSDGEILLVQEGKDHNKGKWDFPGGGWENNESIIECVKREVLEETGYLTKPEGMVRIWKGESLIGGNEVIVFIFESKIIERKNKVSNKEDEILQSKFFKPEEIRNLELRRENKIEILEKYEEGETYSLDILHKNLNPLNSQ